LRATSSHASAARGLSARQTDRVIRNSKVNHILIRERPSIDFEERWNSLLDDADYASHYTSPAVFDEPYMRKRPLFALFVGTNDHVDAVLTGFSEPSQVTSGATFSPNLCVRRGANMTVIASSIDRGLLEFSARGHKFISVYSWREIPEMKQMGYREHKEQSPRGTILLDLKKPADQLFKEFSETRRNKIRRAIKAGVVVTEMDVDREFDEYYDIYSHWCKFKHIDLIPYDVQRETLSLQGNRLLLTARHDGKLVGVSIFRYRRPGIIEYAANVSRREDSRVRQNDLLLWRAIEWASAKGDLRCFSLAGAHFFLQKFGGAMYPTYRYSKDLSFLRRRHAKESLMNFGMSVYRKLPDPVKQAIRRLAGRDEESD
jgi:hypothetical protein